MGVKGERIQAKFNLPKELTERLSKVVPSGERSRFVAKAIEDALKEEAKRIALAQLDTLQPYPTGDDRPIDVLRGFRERGYRGAATGDDV